MKVTLAFETRDIIALQMLMLDFAVVAQAHLKDLDRLGLRETAGMVREQCNEARRLAGVLETAIEKGRAVP